MPVNLREDKAGSRIFHYLEWVVESVIEMKSHLTAADFGYRPDPGKRSLGERLPHIALICEADARISDEHTTGDSFIRWWSRWGKILKFMI